MILRSDANKRTQELLPAKNLQEQVFFSYAQNFEDVMLWRCFKDVKVGFYIDVGAAWPLQHSVTKAFYDRNWSGINVEPNPLMYEELVQERPRDLNLNLALGEAPGEAPYYLSADSGLSTLRKDFLPEGSEQTLTKVATLHCIWERYIQSQDVHFLKIDVEGFERQVILGNNWTLLRPWVVVIEATLPGTPICNKDDWEKLLLNAEYKFAYWDGLNCFYVSKEHAELLEAFSAPPNVFDQFVLHYPLEKQEYYQKIEARAITAEENLLLVYQSRSWRLTRFLRDCNALRHRLKKKLLRPKAKHSVLKINQGNKPWQFLSKLIPQNQKKRKIFPRLFRKKKSRVA